MKKLILFLFLLPLAVLANKPLVVHEWGTFTSFSGSDGVRLEYRPLLDEDLPYFVLDRFLQSGTPNLWLADLPAGSIERSGS